MVSGYINHHSVDELWLADSDVVLVPKTEGLILDENLELLFTRGIYTVFPYLPTPHDGRNRRHIDCGEPLANPC